MTNTKGNMSGHTPGPWRVQLEIEHDLLRGTERHVRRIYSNADITGSRCVCEIQPYQQTPEADAALIAAAPELLACLKSLLIDCDGLHAPELHPEIRERIEAAIAKATGEAKR